MTNLKNLIDFLPFEFKEQDTYKVDGKGILERFLEICGNYFQEDITKDIEDLKHQMSDVLIIKTKIDVIDKEFDNEKRIRSDCQRNVDSRLTDIVNRREKITDKISTLESKLNDGLRDLETRFRTEFESKIGSKTSKIESDVKDIQLDIKGLSKSVAFDSGKYGGIVGLVITIIMFLAKTLWDHLIKK